MARLPVPNSDDGVWGNVLNDFLNVEHNADGTLKASGSLSTKADDSSVVHTQGMETIGGSKTFLAPVTVAAPTQNSHATTKAYVDATTSAGAPDASTSNKGLVQLAGDLGGTATAPTVPGLATKANSTDVYTKTQVDTSLSGKADTTHTHAIADVTNLQTSLNGKEPTVATGTTSDYYRGDKSWQPLNKAAVGLANVDNTSDANKSVSNATQAALSAKADASSLATVATSGSYADLTNKPTIPTVSDATTTSKGIVQLAGDLGGTATAPTVPGLASKASSNITVRAQTP